MSPKNRAYQRSPERMDSHRWYGTRRWRRRAKAQLYAEPLCVQCAAAGLLEPANVADHVLPHNGDPDLFWYGELQSLCTAHHSGAKQSAERAGVEYSSDIGADGLPTDPRHPANR